MGGGGKNEVPESFDRAASTKRATLVREQWDDYKTRFNPVENQIIADMGAGTQTRFNDQGVAMAGKSAETAYGLASEMEARDQQRYGLGMTTDQKQSKATEYDINKTASKANATNTARQWDVDRRNAVMSGGLGNAATAGKN